MTFSGRLTARVIACLVLSCAVVGCGSGTAGPPTAPSNPIGGAEATDPSGYEPPGISTDAVPGAGATTEELCAYDCMRFEVICPNGGSASDCATSCAQAATNAPNCTAQFQAYLACIAAAPVTCTNGKLEVSACDGAVAALNNCSGLGTGTGSGSAGASGSSGGGTN